VLVDQPDQLPADLPDQHHPHDVDRLRGGDAQAAAELGGKPEPVEHRGDLRAAAVHHDRVDAGEAQENHVLGEGLLQLVVDHGVAAVLDHDDLVVEPLQPGQGLGEDTRLLTGPAQPTFKRSTHCSPRRSRGTGRW
jgi:hypothetical protein